MIIYCVKCKNKTDTRDPSDRISKNGRNMIQGFCTTCGTKKTRFVKK